MRAEEVGWSGIWRRSVGEAYGGGQGGGAKGEGGRLGRWLQEVEATTLREEAVVPRKEAEAPREKEVGWGDSEEGGSGAGRTQHGAGETLATSGRGVRVGILYVV